MTLHNTDGINILDFLTESGLNNLGINGKSQAMFFAFHNNEILSNEKRVHSVFQ